MPERRKADRRRTAALALATAAFVVSIAVAGVVALTGLPALLDTSSDVDKAQTDVAEVQRLARENEKRIDEIARLQRTITRESRRRRDQSCKQDETLYRRGVKGIRRTYAYLDGLSPEDYGTNLTEAIVRGLPDQRAEAKANRPPPFCNDPGIGLAAPSPELPPPRNFDRLLHP